MRQSRAQLIGIIGISTVVLGGMCTARRSLGAIDSEQPVHNQKSSKRISQTQIAQKPLIVTTQLGQAEGIVDAEANVFKGIPYAAVPVGDLRWRAPQQAQSWQGIRKMNAFSKACIQPQPNPSLGLSSTGPQSEDCLYLNVWTPQVKSSSKKPVMVWIHGGAFVIGASSLPLWSGAPLAKKGAVVVNLNYRLGQLGFFAHPALDGETSQGPANFGLLDQIAALKWVKQNIAAFGGDPNNVTIFGESAGGQSVLALMTSPLSRGLFQKAIAQSPYGVPEMTRLKAVELGGRIASAVGLNGSNASLAELRAVPAEKFGQLKVEGLSTSPVPISGDSVLPKPILSSFDQGDEARVPLVIGSTSNDASIATDSGINPAALVQRLGVLRGALMVLYPGVKDDNELGLQLFRDAVFTAPARRIAALHARYAPSWRYYFSYVPAGLRSQWANGVPHGGEIAFAMNTVDLNSAISSKLTGADRAVAERVNNYWLGYAQNSKPFAANSPVWPSYSLQTDKTMDFGERFIVQPNFMKVRLDTLIALYSRMFPTR